MKTTVKRRPKRVAAKRAKRGSIPANKLALSMLSEYQRTGEYPNLNGPYIPYSPY